MLYRSYMSQMFVCMCLLAVGKVGLVSCLEFTFSISLMVVVAWKSIVLCGEPTKIFSRHQPRMWPDPGCSLSCHIN